MRTSVPPWVARVGAGRGSGLAGPILAAFAAVLIAVSGMFAMQLAGGRSQHESADGARHAEQVLKASNTLERRVIDLETGVRGYLLTRDSSFLQPYDRARRALPGELAELKELTRVPAQARRARELIAGVRSYTRHFADPLRTMGPRLRGKELVATAQLGKRELDRLRRGFAAFNAAEERIAAARWARADARADRASVIAGAGLAVSALLLGLLAAYLRRHVLRPVRRVARAAVALADGGLDARVDVAGRGEIALLGGAFNTMADALAERELRVTNDRLQGILDHATTTIAVKDLDGRYVLVNRRWEIVAGVDAGGALGRTDMELFGPEVAAPGHAADEAVLRTRRVLEEERDVTLHGVRRSY